MRHMSNAGILDEFKAQLDRHTKEANCGRHFVLVDSFQTWLRSPIEEGTHAGRLLHRVAYSNRQEPGLPITTDTFRAGDDCCLLVFCILLVLDRGYLIDKFSEKGKVDRLLPLAPDDIQAVLRSQNEEDTGVVSAFLELQNRFRPARFELHRSNHWDENVVLPIHQKNPIKRGGTASLYQIIVPEEFVGKNLRSVASGSRFNANANAEEDPDWHYQFALKTFSSSDRILYENETGAFYGLKDHGGMVKWLSHYEQVHNSTTSSENGQSPSSNCNKETTYNILLEYGAMDLGVYFEQKLPPVLPSEIEAFWRSLSAIAYATKGVHNLKVSNAGETKEYFGWHADIKVDNILYVEDGLSTKNQAENNGTSNSELNEITFKLADPGFAKFINKTEDRTENVPREYLLGGTETYGAPEYPGRSRKRVSQAIDIWSLACVLSLAATWVVCDYTGVCLFNKVRKLAVTKAHEEPHCNKTQSDRRTSKNHHGDQFHNGSAVLKAVTDWHIYLRKTMRKTDNITPQVLDLVDQHMLVMPPEQRIDASGLCEKLDQILKSPLHPIDREIPDTIKVLLGEIDEEESYHAAKSLRSRHVAQESSHSGRTITLDTGRRTLVNRPLVTTHRQSIWPQQSWRPQDWKHAEMQALGLSPIPDRPDSETPEAPQTPINHHRDPSGNSLPRTPNRSGHSSTTKRHPPQNYFQATEALDKRDSEHKKGIRQFFSRKDDLRDGLLTSYFQENRDIIFLVDNARSMDEHWFEAKKILELLVRKAKGQDKNGMDLHFTTGHIQLSNNERAPDFVQSMNKARPKTDVSQQAQTDLRMSLGKILQNYSDKLHRRQKVDDAVVIILTDGLWEGMENISLLVDQIKNFSNLITKTTYNLRLRPFSIQFIQFGNHPRATERLRFLDDCLEREGIPDFIDTEHSTGDVNKMLLGSFVPDYDADEGNEMSPQDSSESSFNLGDRTMSPEPSHEGSVPDEQRSISRRTFPHMATGSLHGRPFS